LGKAGVPLATTQVQCSLLSAGPETRAALSAAADLGVTVLAYSPLALGMLSGAYGPGRPGDAPPRYPAGPRGALFRRVLPKAGPLLTVVSEIAASKRCTPSQVALAWCVALDTIPIPGARCAEHVASHAAAARVRLSAGDVAALDGAAAALGKAKATMPVNVFQTK